MSHKLQDRTRPIAMKIRQWREMGRSYKEITQLAKENGLTTNAGTPIREENISYYLRGRFRRRRESVQTVQTVPVVELKIKKKPDILTTRSR